MDIIRENEDRMNYFSGDFESLFNTIKEIHDNRSIYPRGWPFRNRSPVKLDENEKEALEFLKETFLYHLRRAGDFSRKGNKSQFY